MGGSAAVICLLLFVAVGWVEYSSLAVLAEARRWLRPTSCTLPAWPRRPPCDLWPYVHGMGSTYSTGTMTVLHRTMPSLYSRISCSVVPVRCGPCRARSARACAHSTMSRPHAQGRGLSAPIITSSGARRIPHARCQMSDARPPREREPARARERCEAWAQTR